MKICFVSPSYLPVTGGTEVAIYELGKRLVDKGCEVVLITSSEGSLVYEDNSGMIIRRTHVPLESLAMSPSHLYGRLSPPLLTSAYVLREILETHKLGKIDILHQFHIFYLGAACVFAKKLIRASLVTSLMGWDTYDPINPLPKFLNPYLAYIMNNSDVVFSPAKQTLLQIKHICKKEVKIIPHGVDINRFNENFGQDAYKEKLGLEKDEVLVLSVQRLVKRKGVEYLLKAMSIVTETNPKIKLVIIGEGKERAHLTKLARDLGISKKVSFLGFVDSDTLVKYYHACDIFVLHSLYEQFGIVLVEGMACGKPIISTKVGAIAEIVDDNETGFLVEPQNPIQLAGAIQRLACNEKLRHAMGAAGRRKVEEKYDWNIIVNKYLDEYQKLINRT